MNTNESDQTFDGKYMDLKTVKDLARHTLLSLENNVNPKLTYIYGLCEPETGEIRYVGKSHRILIRMRQHFTLTRHKNYKFHASRWIVGLLNSGKEPSIVILETINSINSEELWKQREMHWIKFLKEAGANLTNSTDGGEGVKGGLPSRLGKKNSPEHIEKVRAKRIGKKWPPRDPETAARKRIEGIRAYYARMKALGLKLIKNSTHSRKSVIQMTKDAIFIKEHVSITAAAKDTGTCRTGICLCVNNKAKTSGGFIWKSKTK